MRELAWITRWGLALLADSNVLGFLGAVELNELPLEDLTDD